MQWEGPALGWEVPRPRTALVLSMVKQVEGST